MDLNAALSTSTLISELNGGDGLTLGNINVINGAASSAVSLSSATTIAEVIDLINAAASGTVTASIDSAGTSLQVVSNNSLQSPWLTTLALTQRLKSLELVVGEM